MSYKANYIAAFQKAHPNYEVTVNGPNKKGLYTVAINGDKGDLRLTDRDLAEATRMFQSCGEVSLSNRVEPLKVKLERVAVFRD
jgi:hypothetical protein